MAITENTEVTETITNAEWCVMRIVWTLDEADSHTIIDLVSRVTLVVDDVRILWQKFAKRLNSGTSIHDRIHFNPVTQQHNDDQRGEFPEKVIDGWCYMKEVVSDDGVDTVDVGHADPHADQGHHGGALHLNLGLGTAEEGCATVNEEDRAKNGDDPIATRKNPLEGQRHPHHRGHQDHGNRENQGDPELAFQITHVHHVPIAHVHIHMAHIHMAHIHVAHILVIVAGAHRHASHVMVGHLTVIHALHVMVHIHVGHPQVSFIFFHR